MSEGPEPPEPGDEPEPPGDREQPGDPEYDEIVVDPVVDDEPVAGSVEVVGGADAYARTPNEIHCLDRAAADHVVALVRQRDGRARIEVYSASGEFAVRSDVLDVDHDVAELREAGADVEPSYVLFLDGCGGCGHHCGCGCGGPGADPVYASPVYASPVYASPVYASASGQFAGTTYASPVYASPVYASPVYASEYPTSGKRATTARPTRRPRQSGIVVPDVDQHLVVLDSGLAAPRFLPKFLRGVVANQGDERDIDPPGPPSHDQPDPPSKKLKVDHLYPVAGHGTFIAGLVEQLAPGFRKNRRSGRRMEVLRVFHPDGSAKVARISNVIAALRNRFGDHGSGPRSVVNMSFSGYGPQVMRSLEKWVRKLRHTGAVVVASAGNDATCRRTYPAALPGVVSVGALGRFGPAPFSNHGDWVRACAPGVDLVSCFYRRIDGPLVAHMPGEPDPDCYDGWARWSGTSFAAPVVAAVLLRHMAWAGPTATAKDAVEWVVDRRSLFGLPGLGTVINWSPDTPR